MSLILYNGLRKESVAPFYASYPPRGGGGRIEIRMPKQQAFTLIELVIVVTILAILAAVAIPVFQELQTQARNSVVRGVLAGVREAISHYMANEVVNGRFDPYPTVQQIRDIQDDPTLPKVMLHGEMPDNPWAPIWNNNPAVDPDGVANAIVPVRGDTDQNAPYGWGYKQATGEFWPNSTVNGENNW